MAVFEERIIEIAAGCMFCSSNPAVAFNAISERNEREIVYNMTHLRQ